MRKVRCRAANTREAYRRGWPFHHDPRYAPSMKAYRLGLPAWRHPGWEGEYFDDVPDRLTHYAGVFNTVEGNTTFYATPSSETIQNWRRQLSGFDFRACFKLPRSVTHERGTRAELLRFLKMMDPILEHAGPFLVQFPDSVGPDQADHIRRILAGLPADIGSALEVRHPDFFTHETTFNKHFEDSGCFRTIMDTRPVFQHDGSDPAVAEARHRKPDLPVFAMPANNGVLVRLVLHPDERWNADYYTAWSKQVAAWIQSEIDVIMMIHCANNQYCPGMARRFHELLQQDVPDIGALREWPISQQSLF